MIDEAAIAKVERKWVGKKVRIIKGYYEGHWGEIARAESRDTFIIRGGTLNSLEPLVGREEFRLIRNTDFLK